MAEQRWLPLESNPQSFNAWSQSLGLNTSEYEFADVFGLDSDCLSWVKQPVKAVLMLFPVTKEYEQMRIEQDKKVEEDGVEGVEDVIYFKQTIGNACGTFALLHALSNSGVPLQEGPLTELFERAKDKSPRERAALLTESDELATVHENAAQTGQTATPNLEDEVDLHFVTFVNHKDHLIELDGRRNSPINHGPIKVGLLEDTAEVVKNVIELTKSHQFNLVTLGPASQDD
ncbi:ubiquitin carboxyl-terminal hydrolase [Sporobolomyces salmoneus]|uniref:ubiquitin carboxyl-terminal hydrolase n=1 Tax=Sporobolomyces salmoneus TaxID=183962 RepID=UPI00317087EE